ncbi:MAG TPA: hypothetical protein VKB80_16565 [Kofleriaceae bacterium]|nr:hypothetical protein [Kofleriaceae bacterium]
MRVQLQRLCAATAILLAGCASSGGDDASDEGSSVGSGSDGAAEADAGGSGGGGEVDAGGGGGGGGGEGDAAPADVGNRDRLLATYFDFLESRPDDQQSNGLIGRDLASVCDLWDRLDSSSQATFLTLTARLEGSILGADGSSALDHITALYRAVGGEGAVETDPGSCGGGEFNRLIMSMDPALHDALVAANDHGGDAGDSGFDLADVLPDTSWRDSGDAAGPHGPFDLSDETDEGGPRGQVQFFRDPASAQAGAPLGRLDLEDVVDPLAIEMDHDYDCAHNSNPTCEYTFYGALCFPQSTELGTVIYTDKYGGFEPEFRPAGCP